MARLTGGPTTEFFSGRVATIFGLSGLARSRITTESLPAGERTVLPLSSHSTFSSLPTIRKGAARRAVELAMTRNVAAPSDDSNVCLACMVTFPLVDRDLLPIAREHGPFRLSGQSGVAAALTKAHSSGMLFARRWMRKHPERKDKGRWPRRFFAVSASMSTPWPGWLGSYGGEDLPDDISRGLFAGEVGSPRLLKMFERFGIKTTWFIPGHSIETFPEGDEGGGRGRPRDRHPRLLAREPDRHDARAGNRDPRQMHRSRRPSSPASGRPAMSRRGGSSRTVTNELLLERGIKYDHSLMHNDFQPYYVRVGDSWTKIDYSKKPSAWMTPLKRGNETDLIEIPASWYLDDLPPMMFIKKSPNSHGFVNPRDIEEMWRDQFDWVYREYDYAVFPMTIHPDVSGRPQVLMMLERLYNHMIGHPGVRFVTMNEMADDFAKRPPRKKCQAAGAMCALCGVLGGAESLDRCCRAARRLHAQYRRAGAPARTAESRRLRRPRAAFLSASRSRLAGHVVPFVDCHRQERDRRRPRPSVAGGREAAGPALRSAGPGADRSVWRPAMVELPAFTPVNLITGFLGSGKTTLLRRLLADPALADTAVLINEFGEVGIDHHLLERIDDRWCCCNRAASAAPFAASLPAPSRPALETRARHGAGISAADHREHRPRRSVSRSSRR